jgi:hypothetical protein
MRTTLTALCVLAALLVAASTAHAGAKPRLGTDASTIDLSTLARDAAPYDGGYAIPLAAERPAWFTPELQWAVTARRGEPVAAPVDAPLPSEIGIRPGSWMIFPYGCTMNFVFSSGTKLGIGTAGHCADGVGDKVTLITLAPGSGLPVLVEIGTVTKHHDNGVGDDFALVEIYPQLYSWVFPTMALVGGPCGTFAGSGIQTVFHSGHGLAIGTGGTPRAGVATTWKADAFGWDSPSIFGDSGSAVRIGTLPAAGDLTHLVVDTKWLPSFVAGTRIGKMISITGGWSVMNSPLCL